MINRTAKMSLPHEMELYMPGISETLEAHPSGGVCVVCETQDGKGNRDWQGVASDLTSLHEVLAHVNGAALEVTPGAVLALGILTKG